MPFMANSIIIAPSHKAIFRAGYLLTYGDYA